MRDFEPHTFDFRPHLVIPKAPHLDSLISQKAIALFVARPLFGKTVPAAVKFHRQPRCNAEKIQEVDAARVLAAKFEISKTPVT